MTAELSLPPAGARYRIRPAELGDLDALMALEALFPSDQLSRRSWRRNIQSPTAVALVAVGTGADAPLLGNVLLYTRKNSRCAHMESLMIDPAARRLGLGSALLGAAEAVAKERGCDRVHLEVRQDNPAALEMHLRRGYEVLEELPKFYADGADGLRMVMQLR